MNYETCKVKIELSDGTRDVIEKSIETIKKPRSWRPAEYAMTKATAKRTLAEIQTGPD